MKYLLIFLTFFSTAYCNNNSSPQLKKIYKYHCKTPSDINEHLPVLKNLSAECESVVEIGIRSMVSTWAILQGLSENQSQAKSYVGIDITPPPSKPLLLAKKLSDANGITFAFWQANDLTIEMIPTDLLFIDSLHTYCHLTYELETFSPQVQKYIAMHDTSAPWGNCDDNQYFGDYSEYPAHYDRTKRGLWPAVEDFLENHPEWCLLERRLNNHGLTILSRKRV